EGPRHPEAVLHCGTALSPRSLYHFHAPTHSPPTLRPAQHNINTTAAETAAHHDAASQALRVRSGEDAERQVERSLRVPDVAQHGALYEGVHRPAGAGRCQPAHEPGPR